MALLVGMNGAGSGVSNTVTLQCAENPRLHYEAAFPFTISRDPLNADVGARFVKTIPGPLYAELLTITTQKLATDWEPA